MKKLTIALILSVVTLTFTNCRKEKDTTATVIVVNAAQEPVSGATVRVYCPSATCNGGTLNEDIDRTATTGSNGKASYNYTEAYKLGQAGFAVLDVEVFLTSDVTLTPEATGVIKIEEEKDNEQTIICQTCP